MMETARTSETSLNIYQTTRRYNSNSHLRTHRRENLKSYLIPTVHHKPLGREKEHKTVAGCKTAIFQFWQNKYNTTLARITGPADTRPWVDSGPQATA
jgi:hypothetical protein